MGFFTILAAQLTLNAQAGWAINVKTATPADSYCPGSVTPIACMTMPVVIPAITVTFDMHCLQPV